MKKLERLPIVWTDYMKYKVRLRKFELAKIEEIIRYSEEMYFDVVTHRIVAVGKHDDRLVIIPYERTESKIKPITIHATTRQQINFRLKTGRFIYE